MPFNVRYSTFIIHFAFIMIAHLIFYIFTLYLLLLSINHQNYIYRRIVNNIIIGILQVFYVLKSTKTCLLYQMIKMWSLRWEMRSKIKSKTLCSWVSMSFRLRMWNARKKTSFNFVHSQYQFKRSLFASSCQFKWQENSSCQFYS